MRSVLNGSLLYRIFDKICSVFESQFENSFLVRSFISPVSSEHVSKGSIFYKLWCAVHKLMCFIYEKLHLDKLLDGSMFTKTQFWCAMTCALASVLPTYAMIVVCIMATLSVALEFAADRQRKIEYTPITKYILMYLLVYLFSVVSSISRRGEFFSGVVFLLFTFFAIVLYNAVTTRELLLKIVKLMILGGVIVSLYGIFQYITGTVGNNEWIDEEMFDGIRLRVYSTLLNPNVLAEYLLLIIPVTVAVFFYEDNPFKKGLYFIACGLMGVCMIFTFSRGGWLGLVMAAALFLVMLDKRFIFLGIIGLIALYFVLPDTIISRFTSIGNMQDSSTAYRVYIWLGTLSMLKDYWFCGTGFGASAFGKVYPAYALHAVGAPHSHNLFLQITSEAGIAALVLFVIICIVFFRIMCRGIKYTEDKKLKLLMIGFASAVFGFMVQSMTDYTFYNYRVLLCFWVTIALGLAAVNIASKKETRDD